VRVLPTLVTLGNLLCGLGSITYVLRSFAAGGLVSADGRRMLYIATMLVPLGMLCDVLDGGIARVTNGESAFGAQIDSLCDVVTFGIAPAVLVKALVVPTDFPQRAAWVLVAAYAVFAVLRLARYNANNETTPSKHFCGLPSPVAAAAVVSVVLLYLKFTGGSAWLSSLSVARYAGYIPLGLPVYTFLIGGLMVTRVRYVHLGPVLLSGRKSFTHLMVLLLVIVATALQFAVIFFAMTVAYITAGLALAARNRIVSAYLPSPISGEDEAALELGPDSFCPPLPQRRRPAGWRSGRRFPQPVVRENSSKP
jgi:CDP-diacylglycerol--serine O-phosphatidyltransferase